MRWFEMIEILVLFMVLFVSFFEFGLGPIPWLIVAEITPSEYRGRIMSIASFVNWSCATVIALATPYLVEYTKYFTFVLVLICSIVIVRRSIPETKERDTNDILREIMGMI